MSERSPSVARTAGAQAQAPAATARTVQDAALLTAVLVRAPGLFWVADRDLLCRFASAPACEQLGLCLDQSVEATLATHAVVDESALSAVEAYRRALTGESVSYETRTKHGHFRCLLEPLHDGGGGVIGVLGSAENAREDPLAMVLRRHQQRSRRMLEDILNQSTAVIYLKDPSGRYLLINHHFERLFSVSNEQIAGRTDFDVFPADVAARLRANDERVLASGGSLNFEEMVPQHDGPHTYVSVKFPLRDDSGAVAALCGISTDITDRLRIAAELRRSDATLAAVIESSTDAIFSADREYRLVACNSVLSELFTSLFGSPPRLGTNLRDVVPGGLADHWDALLDRALAGERFTVEEQMPVEGELRYFHISLNPTISDGRVSGITAFAKDITELRRAEEHARQHQAELAHVLRLHTMGEAAASLAHEINQPLGAIANYAQGCKRRLQGGAATPEELLFTVEEITREALRAGEITRRVRELLRKDEPHRAPMDINQIVAAALDIVAPAARQRAVQLRFRRGAYLPAVEMDSIQIEQVVLNLLLNGLDAVDAGGPARTVEVQTTTGRDGGIEVAVRDGGIGIDPTQLERIFEPFLTTKPNGLGMGLAISRSIIEAHGGRLWAEANPDGGATFLFTLPTSASPPDRPPPS